MPRYDYMCKECGVQSEITHSMSDVATDCPACGAKDSLTKQLAIARVKTSKMPAKTGAIVKKAIKDYKNRISEERGVWEDFEIDAMVGDKK